MNKPSLPPGFFMNATDSAALAASGKILASSDFEQDVDRAIQSFTHFVEFCWPPSKRINEALKQIASGDIADMTVGMARLYLLDRRLEKEFHADLEETNLIEPLAVIEAISRMKERAASLVLPGKVGAIANVPLDRLLMAFDIIADRYEIEGGLGSHENMSRAIDEAESSSLPPRIEFVRAGVELACRYGKQQTSGGLANDREKIIAYYAATVRNTTPRAIAGRLVKLRTGRAIAAKIDQLPA